MSEPKDVVADVEKEATEPASENGESVAAKPKASSGTPSRKGTGAKEAPAFQWKIIGESGGIILTLFKSVEREEADTQLDRLTREGYYGNLRIVDINYPIKQSASAKIEAFGKIEAKPKRSRRSGEQKKASTPTAEKKTSKSAGPAKRGTSKKAGESSASATAKTKKKKSPATKSPKRRAKKK